MDARLICQIILSTAAFVEMNVEMHQTLLPHVSMESALMNVKEDLKIAIQLQAARQIQTRMSITVATAAPFAHLFQTVIPLAQLELVALHAWLDLQTVILLPLAVKLC